MAEANVLGQILIMQSVVNSLPTKEKIAEFICKGLKDVPGIKHVELLEQKSKKSIPETTWIPLSAGKANHGELLIHIGNREAFAPYAQYLQNFAFTVAVILEERELRKKNEEHQKQLEERIAERTIQLSEEIEERKAIYEHLQQSEERFRTLVDQAPDAVYLSDMKGRIILTNQVASRTMGYTIPELLQKTIMEIDEEFPELEKLSRLWNAQKPNVPFQFRAVHKRKDGSLMPVEINASIILFDGRRNVLGYVRDVSERIESQRKEKELLYRNQMVLDTSHDGFVLANSKGDIIEVNKAYTDIVGFSEEELLTKNIRDMDAKDSDEEVKNRLSKIDKEGSIRFNTEHRHKSGKNISMSISISKMKQGKEEFFAAFCRDVTKEKMVEQELIKQNESFLELNKEYIAQNKALTDSLAQIKDINSKLEIARKKAEESDRLKSAFLANMSHEIRTPMNGILGFADLLKTPDLSIDKQSRYIEIIKRSGERMLNIINDLIDISKIEAGQVNISEDRFNCNEVLESQHAFFSIEAEKKGINLLCNLLPEDENLVISTDKTKVNQVLTNLLKNALKFTSKGTITFGCIRKKTELLFYVKDTGRGIKTELLGSIFERFRQGDLGPEVEEEGAGLGLSICKAYVELLGGSLQVKSTWQKGSEFTFTLPIILNDIKEELQNDTDLEELYQAEREILIAEDDAISSQYLEEILQDFPIKVFKTRTGNDALSLIKENPKIDLVLMDLKMPGMNGFQASQILRNEFPNLVIIAQSAFSSTSDINRAIQSGCNDYLLKPVKREDLLAKLIKYKPATH